MSIITEVCNGIFNIGFLKVTLTSLAIILLVCMAYFAFLMASVIPDKLVRRLCLLGITLWSFFVFGHVFAVVIKVLWQR